jgi:hypothetical protein
MRTSVLLLFIVLLLVSIYYVQSNTIHLDLDRANDALLYSQATEQLITNTKQQQEKNSTEIQLEAQQEPEIKVKAIPKWRSICCCCECYCVIVRPGC